MKRICLALPADRPCADAVAAIAAEAQYAASHFDVEVHLLILDSSDERSFAVHAETLDWALRSTPDWDRDSPRVVGHHLADSEQRQFLNRVIQAADAAKPDLVLDLLLPGAVSDGACTNRAFLYAAALGCESIHRRDAGSRYQVVRGRQVFPIHHELATIGRRAVDAADDVTENYLDPAHAYRPVSLVGGSFVGEPSADLGEMYGLDAEIYHDVVSLRAPSHWPAQRKLELAEASFRGAGDEPFLRDHSMLGIVEPLRIDMCNISFDSAVYERVPMLPAVETIGGDYLLTHLIASAQLPGVWHNRNIVSFHTPQQRTDAEFQTYQLRFVKFLLSMLYLNFIYERMEQAGSSLLDERDRVRPDAVAGLARLSAGLDRAENVERLRVLEDSYRRLGGRFAEFAELLAARGPQLLDEAQADIEDFALLTELWESLVGASKAVGVMSAARR